MSIFALLILAFGMSMDAFSAAVAKGTAAKSIDFWRACKYGLVFGVIEAIAPIIGWFLGYTAQQWIGQYDHWLAFVLLTVLGVRCIYEAYKQDDSNDSDAQSSQSEITQKTKKDGIWLVITAISTSIDALVVGVSLAFLSVNIWIAALMIGAVSAVMSTAGLYLGRRLGSRFGKEAMIVGGVVLILIGCGTLYSHLVGG